MRGGESKARGALTLESTFEGAGVGSIGGGVETFSSCSSSSSSPSTSISTSLTTMKFLRRAGLGGELMVLSFPFVDEL